MTKDQYFEMCETLGSEPLDEEIPIEYDDLVSDVQEALRIYNNLSDSWDYMGGNYIGKVWDPVSIFEIYDIDKEDRRVMYEFIMKIDSIRAKSIRDSKPKK